MNAVPDPSKMLGAPGLAFETGESTSLYRPRSLGANGAPNAFQSRGPQRQVFVAGVEVGGGESKDLRLFFNELLGDHSRNSRPCLGSGKAARGCSGRTWAYEHRKPGGRDK